MLAMVYLFFFQAEDGIRDVAVTGVQTCALPISSLLSRTFAHQSTAATKSEFVSGLNAAPFHSTPPWIPGQKWTRWSRESGASTFSRVVVGICDRSGRTAVRSAGVAPRVTRERSRMESRPSLFAEATIRLPERVVASVGGMSTSQSWLSRFTSWL